jgi:hypothetical protein
MEFQTFTGGMLESQTFTGRNTAFTGGIRHLLAEYGIYWRNTAFTGGMRHLLAEC